MGIIMVNFWVVCFPKVCPSRACGATVPQHVPRPSAFCQQEDRGGGARSGEHVCQGVLNELKIIFVLTEEGFFSSLLENFSLILNFRTSERLQRKNSHLDLHKVQSAIKVALIKYLKMIELTHSILRGHLLPPN